jgi:ATP-dependent protease HslVU (ClpYQ) peptidase subunit
VMGADSAVSTGDVVQQLASPKIVQLGEALVGAAGSLLDAQIILTGFVPPTPKNEDVYAYMVQEFIPAIVQVFRRRYMGDPDADTEDSEGRRRRRRRRRHEREDDDDDGGGVQVTLLVAYRNRIFTVSQDGAVVELAAPYAAIGSGQQFALGALAGLQVSGADEKLSPEQRVIIALSAAATFSSSVAPPFTVFKTMPTPSASAAPAPKTPKRFGRKGKKRGVKASVAKMAFKRGHGKYVRNPRHRRSGK